MLLENWNHCQEDKNLKVSFKLPNKNISAYVNLNLRSEQFRLFTFGTQNCCLIQFWTSCGQEWQMQNNFNKDAKVSSTIRHSEWNEENGHNREETDEKGSNQGRDWNSYKKT